MQWLGIAWGALAAWWGWGNVMLVIIGAGVPLSLWSLHSAPKVRFRWPWRWLTNLVVMLFWFALLGYVMAIRNGWLR